MWCHFLVSRTFELWISLRQIRVNAPSSVVSYRCRVNSASRWPWTVVFLRKWRQRHLLSLWCVLISCLFWRRGRPVRISRTTTPPAGSLSCLQAPVPRVWWLSFWPWPQITAQSSSHVISGVHERPPVLLQLRHVVVPVAAEAEGSAERPRRSRRCVSVDFKL